MGLNIYHVRRVDLDHEASNWGQFLDFVCIATTEIEAQLMYPGSPTQAIADEELDWVSMEKRSEFVEAEYLGTASPKIRKARVVCANNVGS